MKRPDGSEVEMSGLSELIEILFRFRGALKMIEHATEGCTSEPLAGIHKIASDALKDCK